MKKFRIVRVEKYPNIFSVVIDDQTTSLFDQFINRNYKKNRKAIQELATYIDEISIVGIRDIFLQYFKHQSSPNICRFKNSSQLKLYLIKWEGKLAILGDGALKLFGGAWQFNPKLSKIINTLKKIEQYLIKNKISATDINLAVNNKKVFYF